LSCRVSCRSSCAVIEMRRQMGLGKAWPWMVFIWTVSDGQFAPHEDLSLYPRTLARDLELLATLLPPTPSTASSTSPTSPTSPPPATSTSVSSPDTSDSPATTPLSLESTFPGEPKRKAQPISPLWDSPLVVFAPPDHVLYPLKGELQDLAQHRGVTVDVKGWGDVMEGSSRRGFGSIWSDIHRPGVRVLTLERLAL
jgi:pantoate--beta-alanine ligase